MQNLSYCDMCPDHIKMQILIWRSGAEPRSLHFYKPLPLGLGAHFEGQGRRNHRQLNKGLQKACTPWQRGRMLWEPAAE